MSFHNVKVMSKDTNPLDYLRQESTRGKLALPMSSGSLRTFSHCPSRWRAGYESPDSEAKQFGRLLDCRLLTPEQFEARYAIQPEKYKSEDGADKPWNNNAKVCRAWVADQMAAGREVVKRSEVNACDVARGRMMLDEVIKAFSECSNKQVWLAGEWKDDATGLVVPVKCLIDYVPRKDTEFANCLGDLKTTRNAEHMAWQRWCYQAGYFIQAAFNIAMYVAATGEDRNTFCFILQENYEPWETAKRMLSQDFLALGTAAFTTMLENYCACLKYDRWPGYDDHDEAGVLTDMPIEIRPQSIQGWSWVRPDSRMAEREAFAPHFNFSPASEPEPEQEPEDIPIP